ncbi:DnaD and phage-associated domain-containing protein [Caminicella sporogenes DSM 14501]|uniref:DnaD and phage-associated domain-containing protein n=2 Tax=Caminicella TaxID=166484 RepID=A0A1M6MZ61_9FIRM|nr:DnaD and phage-associated domain-containing protein [Caminicella sporogenes DSM 14501]
MYNSLSTGAIALWHALMAINNKAGWIEEFTVANIVLQSMTGLSRQGLDKARNMLVQKSLIEYKKGKGNQAGKYRLIPFECQIVGTNVDINVDTKVAQMITQKGHSSSTLNKLNINKNNNKHQQQQKGTEQESESLTNNDFKKIVDIFNKNIHPIAPLEGEILSEWLKKVEASVIIEAIRESVKSGVRNIKYIEKILQSWHSNGLTTKEAVIAHLRDYQDKKNKGKVVPMKIETYDDKEDLYKQYEGLW